MEIEKHSFSSIFREFQMDARKLTLDNIFRAIKSSYQMGFRLDTDDIELLFHHNLHAIINNQVLKRKVSFFQTPYFSSLLLEGYIDTKLIPYCINFYRNANPDDILRFVHIHDSVYRNNGDPEDENNTPFFTEDVNSMTSMKAFERLSKSKAVKNCIQKETRTNTIFLGSPDDCMVCLETIRPDGVKFTMEELDCYHRLCDTCLGRLEKPECPMCRAFIPYEIIMKIHGEEIYYKLVREREQEEEIIDDPED